LIAGLKKKRSTRATHDAEIAQVATEIKDYVKLLPGSNYLIDRRLQGRSDA
jgi:hypothetical protein